MAGVAQNVQVVSNSGESVVFEQDVSASDLGFSINTSEDTSLQELIDSELALRISNTESEKIAEPITDNLIETFPVKTVHPITFQLEPDINEEFIFNEREHTALQLNNYKNTENLITDDILNEQDHLKNNTDILSEPDAHLPDHTNNSDILVDESIGETGQIEVTSFENCPDNIVCQDDTTVDITDTNEHIFSETQNIPSPTEQETVLIDYPSDKKIDKPANIEIVVDEENVCENEVIESPEIIITETNCDVSEQGNKNIIVDVVENLVDIDNTSDVVNNSMGLINSERAESVAVLKKAADPEPEPLSDASSPIPSPTNNQSHDILIKINGTADLEDNDGFESWTTVEEATKPEENILEETKIIVHVTDDSEREQLSQESTEIREPEVSLVNNTKEIEVTTHIDESLDKAEDLIDGDNTVTQPKPALHECDTHTINNQTDSDSEVSETTTTLTKTVKKKKSLEGGEATVTRTKKTKKTKKSEEKENHISVITNGHSSIDDCSPTSPAEHPSVILDDDDLSNVCVRDLKSSFNKFDQLSKKAVLHVRSSDAAKAQKQFSQGAAAEAVTANPSCKSCGKTVFAMEQIKAERSVWHKNCFRCKECSKQLTVDIYQSHEGELYCKPHFRELFKPKAVLENTDEPTSDKADLGLEELSSLNVKSRYQVFEKTNDSEVERSPSTVNVKRSPSILSKLARFQKKGMDIGVTDESLNGIEYEESSSSEEEEIEETEIRIEGVIKGSKRAEKPVSFNKMKDVKQSWESGQTAKREERREERKQEIQSIRSRLFMGKQGKMKEMYEQAVAESEGRTTNTSKKEVENLRTEKARILKERFERGEPIQSDSEDEDGEKKIKNKETEDMSVFEAGISKKSRSIFLELDASAAKSQTSPQSPPATVATRTTERRTSQNEDSPDREIYRDPTVVRCDEQVEDEELVKRSHTASKMLSLFRQMEEAKETVPDGPKPLKCFTPPPDYKEEQSGSSEEEEEEEESEEEEEEYSDEDTGIVRASDKIEDEFLKQAQNAARAKALKEKFEHWEPEKQSVNNAINLLESEQESIESTKSLRARFESLKNEQPKEKPRPKVNRFVLQDAPPVSSCAACDKKVYPLEKIETNGKQFHKACFRCTQCSCILRMESYTLNNGQLYCLPHFKQLFIAKGNYDEGFGSDQHKRKWESSAVTSPNPTQAVNGAH